MQIRNLEEEIFGGRGVANGHLCHITVALLHEGTEGIINPRGEDLFILVLPLVSVMTLISTLSEVGV